VNPRHKKDGVPFNLLNCDKKRRSPPATRIYIRRFPLRSRRYLGRACQFGELKGTKGGTSKCKNRGEEKKVTRPKAGYRYRKCLLVGKKSRGNRTQRRRNRKHHNKEKTKTAKTDPARRLERHINEQDEPSYSGKDEEDDRRVEKKKQHKETSKGRTFRQERSKKGGYAGQKIAHCNRMQARLKLNERAGGTDTHGLHEESVSSKERG